MLKAYFLQEGRHIYSSFSTVFTQKTTKPIFPQSPTKLSIIYPCPNFIYLVGNPPWGPMFLVDNEISLSLFWWILWEVNHLCFPPSRHLLVVDSERWWTARSANQRPASSRCGAGVQSRSAGAELASLGREPGGGRSRSDSSDSRPWCDTDQRSCD